MAYKQLSSLGRRCLECGNKISFGRSDKKYCCERCKNQYNNKAARSARIARAKVESILEKNYSVLSDMLKLNISSMDMNDLCLMGFTRGYMTSYKMVGKLREHHLYDLRYYISDRRIFKLRRDPLAFVSGRNKNKAEIEETTPA